MTRLCWLLLACALGACADRGTGRDTVIALGVPSESVRTGYAGRYNAMIHVGRVLGTYGAGDSVAVVVSGRELAELVAELSACRDSLATERSFQRWTAGDTTAWLYGYTRGMNAGLAALPRVNGRAVGYPSLGLDPDSALRLVRVDRLGRVVVSP